MFADGHATCVRYHALPRTGAPDMQNFEQVRSHVTATGYQVTVHEPYVLCVDLSLDQGSRRQSIFLVELQDDDGRCYLRASTAVAPTTALD
ncbi:MAG TPA: hypothetical protein VK911_08720, partial [Vicinamibacterales bacterium]|nr:hypothetical protein [Vicinamibacterales bacterium]